MSENIHQIYVANPIISNSSTDLMYFGQSPYGSGNDAAMLFSNFASQFLPLSGATSITTLGTIVTGTWEATLIDSHFGGTGTDNSGLTIKLDNGQAGYILTSDSSGNATWQVNGALGGVTSISVASPITASSSTGNVTLGINNATTSSLGAASFNATHFSVTAGAVSANNFTVTAGTGLSGGGSLTLGGSVTLSLGSTIVSSLAGTSNQIVVSGSTGAITLSLANGLSLGTSQSFTAPVGGILCPGKIIIGATSQSDSAAKLEVHGGFLGTYYNSSGVRPNIVASIAGLSVGWNFSNSGEVNFYNNYISGPTNIYTFTYYNSASWVDLINFSVSATNAAKITLFNTNGGVGNGNIYGDATYGLHLDTASNSSPISIDGSFVRIFNTMVIGTTTPATSAILTLASTTTGFLPPRMTTTQKNAISSPAGGLVVYDSTLLDLQFYNGSSWIGTTGSGVTSIAGTADQIVASSSTGAVTLSLSSTLLTPGTLGTTGQVFTKSSSAADTHSSLEVHGGFFETYYDSALVSPVTVNSVAGLAIGWNFSGGSAEVNFWNNFGLFTSTSSEIFNFLYYNGTNSAWQELLRISQNTTNATRLFLPNTNSGMGGGNIYGDATYDLHFDTGGNNKPIALDGSAVYISSVLGVKDPNPGTTFSVSGNAQIGFAPGTTAPANGLVITGQLGIGTTTFNDNTYCQILAPSGFSANLLLNGTLTNLDGATQTAANYATVTFSPTSNAIHAAAYYAFCTFSPPTGVTIAKASNVYSDVGVQSGAGSITNGYGGYFSLPAFGTSKQALYADNLSIGYTSTDLSGTNKLVVSGQSSFGTATPISFIFHTVASSTSFGYGSFVSGSTQALGGTHDAVGLFINTVLTATASGAANLRSIYISPNYAVGGGSGTTASMAGIFIDQGTTTTDPTVGYGIYVTNPLYGTTTYSIYTEGQNIFAYGGLLPAFGFNQTPSLILGTNGSLSGCLKFWSVTSAVPCLIQNTIGNLHIDTSSAIYLNYYSGGGGTIFGNGASGGVASVSGSGLGTFSGLITTAGINLNSGATQVGAYSVSVNDYYVNVNTSGGSFTVTLPASLVSGKTWVIKDVVGSCQSNNLTISGNGNNIDGVSTILIATNYGSVTIYSNGSAYFIV